MIAAVKRVPRSG